ncbi:MAG: hypothetical protein H0T46_26020 [Deltaproteobacteria bacterium]|nr:hypothetical protein [Deltaproteobacteria bacterium]
MVDLSRGTGNLTVVAFAVNSTTIPAQLEHVGEVVERLMLRIRAVENRVYRVMHAEAAVATAEFAVDVRTMIADEALVSVPTIQIRGVSVTCTGVPTPRWLDDVLASLGAKHNYGVLDEPSAEWLIDGQWRRGATSA